MKNDQPTAKSQTIGLDLGHKQSHFCVLDAEGEVRREGHRFDEPHGFSEVLFICDLFAGGVGSRHALPVGQRVARVSRSPGLGRPRR